MAGQEIRPGREELVAARREGRSLLGVVFLFSIFVNLLMLTGPLFMLQVYDRVLSSRSEATLVALFVLVAVLYGLYGILDYARGRVLARYGARFQTRLDKRIFAAALQNAVYRTKLGKPGVGLRDIESVQSLFTSPVLLSIFDAMWTPLFIAAIFIFHPLLGWLSVAGATILLVVTLINQLMTRAKQQEAQQASGRAYALSEQSRLGAEIVWSQGMLNAVQTRWQSMRNGALGRTIGANDWTGSFTSASKAFRFFLQSAMLALGAWLVLQQQLTAGAMIAGSILLGRALAPIEQGLGQWPVVQRAMNGWKALIELLENTPPQPDMVDLPTPKSALKVENMSVVSRGNNRHLLQGLSFDVQPGEALGIIGKSGAGKTTLAKTLIGLIRPTVGTVRLDGAKLDQYGSDALGRHIGYLPQDVFLFDGTVAENIARMALEPDDKQVIAAAQGARAHDIILHLKDGYNTVLMQNDGQLSGGQRQRVALARALYGDPVLLILDEPNSALDADGSDALNTAVRNFKDTGRAVIIMTHRPGAISACDKLLVLADGKIAAYGPRDEVLKKTLRNSGEVQQMLKKSTRKAPVKQETG